MSTIYTNGQTGGTIFGSLTVSFTWSITNPNGDYWWGAELWASGSSQPIDDSIIGKGDSQPISYTLSNYGSYYFKLWYSDANGNLSLDPASWSFTLSNDNYINITNAVNGIIYQDKTVYFEWNVDNSVWWNIDLKTEDGQTVADNIANWNTSTIKDGRALGSSSYSLASREEKSFKLLLNITNQGYVKVIPFTLIDEAPPPEPPEEEYYIYAWYYYNDDTDPIAVSIFGPRPEGYYKVGEFIGNHPEKALVSITVRGTQNSVSPVYPIYLYKENANLEYRFRDIEIKSSATAKSITAEVIFPPQSDICHSYGELVSYDWACRGRTNYNKIAKFKDLRPKTLYYLEVLIRDHGWKQDERDGSWIEWDYEVGWATISVKTLELTSGSYIWIYTGNSWEKFIPLIYTENGWEKFTPLIYTGNGWEKY